MSNNIKNLPESIQSIKELENVLSTPDPHVIDTMRHLEGDLIFLGVGGKMGPTIVRMAKRAIDAAGVDKRIVGVSRFSSPGLREQLESEGIDTITGDLLDRDFLNQLPEIENVIFMAGRKFGSTGEEWYTWAMNVYVPGMVAERFFRSRLVVFSTGNVYPLTSIESGGSRETDRPEPVGEYAQSCLGRERMFQHFSMRFKSPAVFIRLNYAIELRYGVLVDVAQKVFDNQPISLKMGYANVIWQGDANAQILRSLNHVETPPRIINITGPDIISIRWLAQKFGEEFGKEPILTDQESETALLSNTDQAAKLFGKPTISLEQMIEWISQWIAAEHPTLNKPTHYEIRDGKF